MRLPYSRYGNAKQKKLEIAGTRQRQQQLGSKRLETERPGQLGLFYFAADLPAPADARAGKLLRPATAVSSAGDILIGGRPIRILSEDRE
jgi:hypothetical protein